MKNKIYLAGPDVFRSNPLEHFEAIKKLCDKYGFIGLSPFDNEDSFDGELFSKQHSTAVFLGNVGLIKNCNIIIANLVPFRGACVDDGTAFEIGCGYANNKILYGYTELNNHSIKDVVKMKYDASFQPEFPGIESFGDNCVNLIIELSGGKILKTFEDCLIDIAYLHQ